MELKDVILSTLAEMEENSQENKAQDELVKNKPKKQQKVKSESHSTVNKSIKSSLVDNEALYLNSIRERLLVLFEGFQAPNNANLEAKLDMTLNFLEYVLATIDSRIEVLEKGKKE